MGADDHIVDPVAIQVARAGNRISGFVAEVFAVDLEPARARCDIAEIGRHMAGHA